MTDLNLSEKGIRQQIASAVNVIVQVSRLSDGTRRITSITEITGMEGQVITTQELYTFERSGLDENRRVRGTFRTTGIRPRFIEKLEACGVHVDKDSFFAESLRGGRS